MARKRTVQPKKKRPKTVKSDLRDVHPSRAGAAFPHDLEQTPPSRKDRRPVARGAPSDHVPHSIPRGDNEQHGGRDRRERKRTGKVVSRAP